MKPIHILRTRTALSTGVVPTTILYGRTAGHSSGTTFDYIVDSINGDDTTGTGSLAAPFKTTTKAHTVAVAAGGNKKIALRGHQGQIYTAAITCVTNGIEFHGYDTEQPKWYGSYTVTGFAQCTAGDASVVGSNYASIYKATFTTSGNIDPTVSFNNLIPLENGVPLNLVQLRHDVSDLYFQDSTDDFYSSGLNGDSVTIGVDGSNHPSTVTHAAVLGNGTTPYTDAQLTNCSIMLHASANKAQLVKVASSSGGVLTLAANSLTKETINGDCYSLLNLIPALSVGQYAVKDNGDGTWTIYVWPNNPANLSAGLPIASKPTMLKFSQCSNNKVSNIEFGQCSNSDTSASVATVVFDRTTNGQFIQNTIQYYGYKDFIGNGGVLVLGGSGNLIQYNDVKEGQNDFGIFLNVSSFTASANRVRNNYVNRTSLTPIRCYGQVLVAVVDNKARSCGKGGHANRINFYLGCDQVLCWRNDLDDNGGYMTAQNSSRLLFGMNFCPSDPTSTDARAFADQSITNDALYPPTNAASSYIINCAFPKPAGNTGTGDSLNVDILTSTENPTSGTTKFVNWGIFNNVSHGIVVESTRELAGSPDYNILTRGTPAGAHSVAETNLDNLYYDYTQPNWNTVPGSILTTQTGMDVSSIVSTWEAWFPDINLRMTLNGYTWDPADPGVGPYGKHWPVQVDVAAPTLSSLGATITGASAACSVTTNERGGTIYWVRYNGGSIPSGVQVVAGQNGAGGSALSSGTVAVSTGPGAYTFNVSGTSGTTDTLAVAHKDRSGNISAVVTTSLAFAAYSPTWTSMNGTNFPRKSSALTGAQASTRKMVAAITISRSAAQLTTGVSGGLMVANGSSVAVPTWGTTSTGKLQLIQEQAADSAFANLVLPSSAMTADMQCLMLVCFKSDGSTATMNATLWNIATGAQILNTATQGPTAGDISLKFLNNYDVFKAAATYERFMLWDNPSIATPDATDATLRGYFMSGGALLDPAVAIANVGTPLISLSDAALAVASGATVTNGGSGGNFTMT